MIQEIKIKINDEQSVTALVYDASKKDRIGATLLLGHGAGADQRSQFMTAFAGELARRGISVVTFNFSYAERGRGGMDRADKLEACYRAAINTVRTLKGLKANKLFIGGKSMGGRIASQVAAEGVDNLSGLVFLGYPLHPPGKPDRLRIEHLPRINSPMLFIQGGRDPFGTPGEIQPVIKKLKLRATLYAIEGGDHSFTVPKSWPVKQPDIYAAAQDYIARWIKEKL